ncbi:hypothetical protein SLS56_003239 [Neofusicoccum ribis]|uniref:Cytochrome P450 monooxygenase n=1 Tax=Neofusicoccum ribis TaxID=45134 RepID=A0ABR3T046_9PEZI
MYSTATALAVMALLLILYNTCSILYNIFFHPLRKFPGPFWSRATTWPLAHARLRGVMHQVVTEMHAQYGEVVRTAPNELSFITSQAWQDIHGHRTGGKGGAFPKDLVPFGLDTSDSGLVVINDGYQRRRRLVSHAFSERALKEQEPIVRKYVNLLIAKLDDIAQLPKTSDADDARIFDMVHGYNFVSFDIMSDLAFGEPLGLLDRSTYTPWVQAVFDSFKLMNLMGVLNMYFPELAKLSSYVVPARLREQMKEHRAFSAERVERRMARSEEDRVDFWKFVLRNQDNKELTLQRWEMNNIASDFMVAGSETTATALSGITWLLLTNNSARKRLTCEIRSTFKSADQMDLSTLAQLPYLQACIEEGLRMYPSFPNAYHSFKNFTDPDSFIPERWLSNIPDARFVNDDKAVAKPFGFGPRDCIGKNLAYHEMRLVLAMVFWHFDLELCEESRKWMVDQKVFNVWEKPPLKVVVSST